MMIDVPMDCNKNPVMPTDINFKIFELFKMTE